MSNVRKFRTVLRNGAIWRWVIFAAALVALSCVAPDVAPAQQDSQATALPQRDPEFRGKIGATFKDSTPTYPQPLKAPTGAPNVLIILLDDVGFGMAETFGGPAPTPTLDRLAKNGLRYNRFHTTALCSPTRAALLAGRNHHTCGTGVVIEMGTGYPGYTGILPRSTALVSEILRCNGYATAMFGKWHNTPENDISPAGPFDRWPTGLGFEYFYGFNQGETHHYYPTLYRNTTPVNPPRTPEEGYHFTADMTDEAIAWTRNVRAADPDKPWFVYYSTGALHAPHHAPREWRDRFVGQFDHGWDAQRDIAFQRQKELGVIPANTRLTPRPVEIPAWDDQPENARRVFCRLMENYAAFLAHTDHEIGRLIDSLEQSDELDNTLVFYIVGDNGASAEGGLEGTFNEVGALFGYNPGLQALLDRVDEIGEPSSEPHVPVGWAWATNAPFQWAKQVASHFGGTRNPLVVHWPRGIKSQGELRSQFHHVVDIAPTILEACRIAEPQEVNGIPQKPIEGVSMAYSFDDDDAKDRRTTQYFEMLGNRGVYHDGWMATTRHGTPWLMSGVGGDFDDDRWELYHLDEDFSQANDLAGQYPEKLKELQAVFLEEARKYDVLPLDDRLTQRFEPHLRVSGDPRTSWTYYGNNIRLPEPVGPTVYPRAHTITAELVIPPDGADGVIACASGLSGGWSVYVKDGRLAYHYNFADFEHNVVKSEGPLPTGKATVKMEFTPGPDKVGVIVQSGAVKLFINGELAAQGKVGKVTFRHGVEPFEVSRDSISPVVSEYADQGSFPFQGTIEKVEFSIAE